MGTMKERNVAIAREVILGGTLKAVGARFSLSPARINCITRREIRRAMHCFPPLSMYPDLRECRKQIAPMIEHGGLWAL